MCGVGKLNTVAENIPLSFSEVVKSLAMRYERPTAERCDLLLVMTRSYERKYKHMVENKSLGIGQKITAGYMASRYFQGRLPRTLWDTKQCVTLPLRTASGVNHGSTVVLPALFITLSAVQTQWAELPVILKSIVHKEEVRRMPSIGQSKNRPY